MLNDLNIFYYNNKESKSISESSWYLKRSASSEASLTHTSPWHKALALLSSHLTHYNVICWYVLAFNWIDYSSVLTVIHVDSLRRWLDKVNQSLMKLRSVRVAAIHHHRLLLLRGDEPTVAWEKGFQI